MFLFQVFWVVYEASENSPLTHPHTHMCVMCSIETQKYHTYAA